MRNSVGLFFNLLLTLLFNKGNVRKEADFYLLTKKKYIAVRRIQKLLSFCTIKLCHINVHVNTYMFIHVTEFIEM